MAAVRWVIVSMVFVLGAAACASDGSGAMAPTTSTTSMIEHPSPAPGGSVAWLELDSTVVQAGATLRGVVVVSNDTGAPISIFCGGDPYDAGIETEYGVEGPSRALVCESPTEIPMGESRWPITVPIAHSFCADATSTRGPQCDPGHIRPRIPAGNWRIIANATPLARGSIPDPAPVVITIE